MVNDDYKKNREQFQRKMEEVKKTLPSNWVQLLLKNKNLTVDDYKKTYNMVVNWVSGRSYRSSLHHSKLIDEIIDLSNKYKELGL